MTQSKVPKGESKRSRIVSKYVVFQLAEVAVPRQVFAAIVNRIDRLRLAFASG